MDLFSDQNHLLFAVELDGSVLIMNSVDSKYSTYGVSISYRIRSFEQPIKINLYLSFLRLYYI